MLMQIWARRSLILLVLVIFLAGTVWFQLDRLARSAENIRNLEENIRQIELAATLTESLRSRNAILEEELDDLKRQLLDAPSYNMPLPDDIRGIVNGLR